MRTRDKVTAGLRILVRDAICGKINTVELNDFVERIDQLYNADTARVIADAKLTIQSIRVCIANNQQCEYTFDRIKLELDTLEINLRRKNDSKNN